jgi:hypothetical protein
MTELHFGMLWLWLYCFNERLWRRTYLLATCRCNFSGVIRVRWVAGEPNVRYVDVFAELIFSLCVWTFQASYPCNYISRG